MRTATVRYSEHDWDRRVLPKGTCRHCGDQWQIRRDGQVRIHGPHPYAQGQWNCPGSRHLPVEGVLMACIWCSRPFFSEDDDHRFCSERCVVEWEEGDGSWDDWPIETWLRWRTGREEGAA